MIGEQYAAKNRHVLIARRLRMLAAIARPNGWINETFPLILVNHVRTDHIVRARIFTPNWRYERVPDWHAIIINSFYKSVHFPSKKIRPMCEHLTHIHIENLRRNFCNAKNSSLNIALNVNQSRRNSLSKVPQSHSTQKKRNSSTKWRWNESIWNFNQKNMHIINCDPFWRKGSRKFPHKLQVNTHRFDVIIQLWGFSKSVHDSDRTISRQ